MIYLIRVGGLLHHGTSRRAEHEAYAARLRAGGHAVEVFKMDTESSMLTWVYIHPSLYLSELADTEPEEADMFANISTKELFEMNSTYTREWLADKDHAGKRALVMETGAELTARGAW